MNYQEVAPLPGGCPRYVGEHEAPPGPEGNDMPATSGLLDASDSVLLLVDHQSGLLQVVKDISQPELRTHLATLAKAAALSAVPVITTASVPDGPNGPLLPEVFDNAPGALYVPRQGEINAWDVEGF
jgi:nicotinamidase-related amidase